MLRKKHTLLDAFKFAFRGIFFSLKKERNLKIHFSAAALAIIFGLILKISTFEWLVIIIFISLVISLEIINSSVEAISNLVRDRLNLDYFETYWVRNFAAGAVLVAAIGAAISGLIIFLPKLFPLL